MTNYIVHLCR